MNLFSNVEPTDIQPLQPFETSFRFINRASGDYWDAMRSTLGNWFANIPSVHQPDLMASLMAKSRKQFEAAFWELYLHELFLKSGFETHFQPTLSRSVGDPLTPDFLLSDGRQEFYVEAATVSESDEDSSVDKRRMDLRGEINRRIASSDFWLDFEIEAMGASSPSISKLCRDLQMWLDGLPHPAQVAAVRQQHRIVNWPKWAWRDDGWSLRFVAWPRDDWSAQHPMPAIWMGPSSGIVKDVLEDGRVIRDVLKGKAKKYAAVADALVIAVLVRRPITRDQDVCNALFGGDDASRVIAASGWTTTSRSLDLEGLWATKAGPGRPKVPAVMSSVNLIPAGINSHTPTVWHNPWAFTPIELRLPSARSVKASTSGGLETVPQLQSSASVFGLPEIWPPGDPFPASRF